MRKKAYIYYPNGIINDKVDEGAIHPALKGPPARYSGEYDKKWMRAHRNNEERVKNDLGKKIFCELIPKDGSPRRYAWLSQRDFEYFQNKSESWEVKPADYPVNTPSGQGREFYKNDEYTSAKWYEAATVLERIKREG
jgi:hypothetical protein